MHNDPVEQILEMIIAHPELFQEHGDKRVLNHLFAEQKFVMEKTMTAIRLLMRDAKHASTCPTPAHTLAE